MNILSPRWWAAPGLVALAVATALVPRADADAIRDLGPDVADLQLNASGQVAGVRGTGADRRVFVDTGGQVSYLDPDIQPIHLAADGRVIDARGPYIFYTGISESHRLTVGTPAAANDQGQLVGVTTQYPHYLDRYTIKHPMYIFQPVTNNDPPGYADWAERTYYQWNYATLAPDIPRGWMNEAYGPAGAQELYPGAINDAGTIAGGFLTIDPPRMHGDGRVYSAWTVHAFRGTQDLGQLPGNTWTQLQAINARGDVAGVSGPGLNDGASLVFAGADGKLVDLGNLPHDPKADPGWSLTVGGMNDLNQIVGTAVMHYWGGATGMTHAFLYDPAKQAILDLNDLLPGTDWVLTDAVGINDAGQVIGYGLLDGVRHGFVLDLNTRAIAVPEPTPLALLALAAAAGLVRSSRRSRAAG